MGTATMDMEALAKRLDSVVEAQREMLGLMKRMDERVARLEQMRDPGAARSEPSTDEEDESDADLDRLGVLPPLQKPADSPSKQQEAAPSSKPASSSSSSPLDNPFEQDLQELEMRQREQQLRWWSGFMVVTVLFSIVWVPFRVAFLDPQLQILKVLDTVAIAAFIADIFIVRRQQRAVAVKHNQEKLVTSLLHNSERIQLKQQFDLVDTDLDGHITEKELKAALEAIGERPSGSQLHRMMQEADLDGNGTIEFSEFCNFVTKFRAHNLTLQHQMERSSGAYQSGAYGMLLYITDLIAAVPFHLLIQPLLGDASRFLLLLQFAKVFRLYELLKILERRSQYNPTAFRLIHLSVISFVIAHWVGCAWWIVGEWEGYGTDSWVPTLELKQQSILAQYVRALYWGFINTTGIDNAAPETSLEVFFSMAVLFIGVSMYATIIGNVGSLLSNLDATGVLYREKMESVTTYLRFKKIPERLQARVLDYYEYLWSRQKGLEESDVLSDLPPPLRTEIALYMNREVLEKVPFFKNASENFLSVLVGLLKPQVYAPGEQIIRFGDIGREMYFINRGVVVVCSEDGRTIFNVLSDGSFFGEYALLFSQKRTASVRSTTDDFQRVLADFPEFELTMRREALKRVVEKVQIFKDFPPEFRDVLVGMLTPRSFVQGEYIVRKGEIGREMYFICRGCVQVCDGNVILKTLTDGDFFGELAVLHSQQRSASVRAITYCDLFELTRKNLKIVLRRFPALAARLQETRSQYVFATRERSSSKGSAALPNPSNNQQAGKGATDVAAMRVR